MSRRATRVTLDRRSLIGGALIGGVGAVLGSHSADASAAPRSVPPRAEILPPDLTSEVLNFRMLLTPVRVYDSRVGQAPDGTDPLSLASDTVVARGDIRRIDVSYVLGNEFAYTGVNAAIAKAVLLNVTAVNTVGASGYLKVWGYGGDEPSISSLNWDHANAVIANSVTSRVGLGYILVKCGGPVGCSTNVIVDVIGVHEGALIT